MADKAPGDGDWTSPQGHYFRWRADRGVWSHDRSKCERPCEGGESIMPVDPPTVPIINEGRLP